MTKHRLFDTAKQIIKRLADQLLPNTSNRICREAVKSLFVYILKNM